MTIQAKRRGGDLLFVEIDYIPDICPVCLRGMDARDLNLPYVTGQNENHAERVFQCPRKDCERYFIGRYEKGLLGPGRGYGWKYAGAAPFTIRPAEVNKIFQEISPDFVLIFQEAGIAEQYGLKLVCGPGYRKALEYLVKDYAILSHKEDAEKIKKTQLGQCIEKYVTDERVKQVAKRAAWLGNDEVHYLRKWDTKDLQDLKDLIELTVHWINMEQLTAKSMREMPEQSGKE